MIRSGLLFASMSCLLLACASKGEQGSGPGTGGAGASGSTGPTGSTSAGPGGSTGTGMGGSATTGTGSSTSTTGSGTGGGSGCAPANVVLSPPVLVPTPAQPASVALADVNKDGKVDLVYTTYGAGLGPIVALGKGDGTFAAGTMLEGGGNNLIVTDLNGDGWPDILSPGTDELNAVLQWAPNNADGSGTFGAFQEIAELEMNGIMQVVADFNGDELPDIVNLGLADLSLVLNTGNGTFASSAQEIYNGDAAWQAALGSGDALGLAVGDFDGDGLPDIAIVVGNQGIYVSLNQDHGTSFSDPIFYPATTNHSPVSIVVADFNGDGKLDIVTGGAAGPTDTFDVYLNKGGGLFKPAAAVMGTGAVGSTSVLAADMNHDGKLDLVSFDEGGLGAWVTLGNGDGTFSTSPAAYGIGYDIYGVPPVALADFAGNGLTGIAVGNDNATSSAPNGGIQVLVATCAK